MFPVQFRLLFSYGVKKNLISNPKNQPFAIRRDRKFRITIIDCDFLDQASALPIPDQNATFMPLNILDCCNHQPAISAQFNVVSMKVMRAIKIAFTETGKKSSQ